MQAVILAAGRGTRMDELTTAVPKPMLEVDGHPLLEYKLNALPGTIDEVVLIVGYFSEVVRRHFGSKYGNVRVMYVEQEQLDGTAGALWCAKEVLQNRFLVMMGDDIYTSEDVSRCVAPADTWRLLVQELPSMRRAGSVQLDDQGNIQDIVESSEENITRREKGLASTNLYVLDTRIFECPLVPKHEGSLEYGLPQTVVAAARKLSITLEPVFTDQWIQITDPKDLIAAAKMLKKVLKV